jgi:hypothetical protein
MKRPHWTSPCGSMAPGVRLVRLSSVVVCGAWLWSSCSSGQPGAESPSLDAAGPSEPGKDGGDLSPDAAGLDQQRSDTPGAGGDAAGPDRGLIADGSAALEPDAPPASGLARTWVRRTSPVTARFESMAASSSYIVAAGQGAVIVSNDGIAWRLPRTPVVASRIAFGAGVFVAVSQAGNVSWSSDGDSWTPASIAEMAKDPGVAFGAGTFALVAHGYGEAWYASPDGRTWTRRGVEPAEVRAKWNFIFTTFGVGGRLFASKASTLPEGNYVTSDGVTWSVVPEWRGITYDIAFDGAIYCATGSIGFIHRSLDGKTWTADMTVAESLLTVAAFEGRFYLAGSFGTVMASRDCVTWEEGASPRMPMTLAGGEQLSFQALRAFKGRLVLVGSGGTIFTSP